MGNHRLKKTVGAWLCGYVEHKQTFILVKIDYCGYDLKPVTLHHQNNYKKFHYENKNSLGFSLGYF